jgi:Flp pilus assembly protein TadG
MRQIRPGQRHWQQDSEGGTRRWNLPRLLRRCSALARRFKIFSRCEGIAAVEFAIILPVLLLLILGGMDLGHAYYIEHLITNASREGARYGARYTGAATDPTSSQISTYVTTTLNYNSFNLDRLVVSGSYSGASPNEIVTVTVQANKQWWILGSLLGLTNPMTFTAQTAMIVEGPS